MLRFITRLFRRRQPSTMLTYIDEQLQAEGLERNANQVRWY